MERTEFIDWAKQLSTGELTLLFYEILGDFPRSPNDYYRGEALKDRVPSGESKLVIAEAVYFAGFGTEPAGHGIEVVALPANYHSLAGTTIVLAPEDATPLQSGSCKKCGADFTSWSKLSQCSICGTENWGT